MIVVRYSGFGSTERSQERIYTSVLEAQSAGWFPIGRAYGHELYKQAREKGFARDGRNSVEVMFCVYF